MDQKRVVLKCLLLLAVAVHLSSACSSYLQYIYTGVTPGTDFPEFTAEGLLDGKQFVYYDSSNRKVIPKTEWTKKMDADDPKQWKDQKQKLQHDQQRVNDSLAIAMQSFSHTEGAHRVQWIYGCELDDGTERRYWKYTYDGEDFLSLDLDTDTWTAAVPQAEMTKLKWEKTEAVRFQKAFLMNECIELLQKCVSYRPLVKTGSGNRRSPDENTGCKAGQGASLPQATHSLQYFYTGVTSGINFPEFTAVGQVDGEQFIYYDSNIRNFIPKTDWIQKIDADDPDYWNRNTQIIQGNQENFKVNMGTLMQRFNQTKGVHTVQVMYGCELDDDGTIRGYRQDGYDGEDFISLDLTTLTWTAPVPQAVPTKLKWEKTGVASYTKNYLVNECIEWLQKYVGYGRSTLERKVSPEVSVFQKDSSSPVVCHATGFFPKAVMVSWQKNGEELHEDVELRETVPNPDGTFQKRNVLTVSPEDLKNNEYTCVVSHSSLKEEIRKGLPGGVPIGIIIAVVAVLLLVVVAGVGVFLWKKKSGFKPVPGSPPSDGENSSNHS